LRTDRSLSCGEPPFRATPRAARLSLDLPDALARETEHLADLCERQATSTQA